MTRTTFRRRLAALLILPFLVLLAGCGKFHADFDIKDVDTINIKFDVAIDTEVAEGVFADAETMCKDVEGEIGIDGEEPPSVEPYEENGQLGCIITGVMTSDNFGGGFSLTEDGGEYHLVIDGDSSATGDLTAPDGTPLDIDFRTTFTFPGKVIDSSGGTIDGNSVTFTDINEFASGVDITAKADGFPWALVIVVVLVLGFLALLAIAAIAFFVIRSRRNKARGTGTPGGYGAPAAMAGTPAAMAGTGGAPAAPPAAPQAPSGQSSQWGQASPPAPAPQAPSAPQSPQWGQPPAAPQGGQPQGGQNAPQWGQNPQQGQSGQPWDQGGQGQQPPQNPGW